jgi:hypothetical protein
MKFGTVDPLVSWNWCSALTRIQASHIVADLAPREIHMRHESAYGVILLSGSVVLLAMGVIHPRAIPFDDNTALARMATMDAWAHSLAILGTWLVLLGLVGLSRLLGLQRVKVMAALLAFALATVGVVVAATLDGFVVPKLAEQWSEADKVVRGNLMQLMRFSVLVASSLTRV